MEGLDAFVAAASGATIARESTADPKPNPREGPRRGWQPLVSAAGWRELPGGVVAGGVVALLIGAVILVVVVGVGGPTPDPALPLSGPSGSSSGDAIGSRGGAATDGAASSAGGDGGGPESGDSSAAEGRGSPGGELVVHVAGAVVSPGVHRLPAGARVHDAIAAAGGPLAGADLDRLNLAAPLTDGTQVHVAVLGEPGSDAGAGGPGGADSVGAGGGGSGSGPVSLSRADAAALDALPGIGPSTAAAIIAHREAHGPFTSVEALLDVRGIGQAKLDGLRGLVVP